MNSGKSTLWSKINPFVSDSMSPSLIILFILLTIFFTILNPRFIALQNFQAIFTYAPLMGILAAGLGVVMLSGNVDLSIGAMAGVAAAVAARLIRDTNLNLPLIIIITILVGIIIGVVNGLFVAYVGINSIIVTLGMWTALRGLAFTICQGDVYYTNETFQNIGRGYRIEEGHAPYSSAARMAKPGRAPRSPVIRGPVHRPPCGSRPAPACGSSGRPAPARSAHAPRHAHNGASARG